jgi:hypothetical protein
VSSFGDSTGSSGFPAEGITSGDNQRVLLDNIYQVSPLFLGDLGEYFTQNPFPIPISQVDGYTAQTPYSAPSIATEETTSSAVFVDLNTPGPLLTGLPDGLYMLNWGATAKISTVLTRARMCISVNGGVPDVSMQAYTQSTNSSGISFQTSLRIQGQTGGNSIKCQYSIGVAPATATFGGRFLTAIRMSGP